MAPAGAKLISGAVSWTGVPLSDLLNLWRIRWVDVDVDLRLGGRSCAVVANPSRTPREAVETLQGLGLRRGGSDWYDRVRIGLGWDSVLTRTLLDPE